MAKLIAESFLFLRLIINNNKVIKVHEKIILY